MHSIRMALLTAAVSLSHAGCSQAPLPRPPGQDLLSGDPALLQLSPVADAARPLLADAGPLRVFISGHSLLDQPVPDQLQAIALAQGITLDWQRRYLAGSSIRDRGAALLPEGPYDALLITEQHGVLASWAWQDSLEHLRRWHDARVADNPAGITYFFVPWMSVDDLANPGRWIAYELAASQVWRCMVTIVNSGIAAEGRPDRIVTLPMNLALAQLIEAADPATRARLFADDVHLTATGNFFVALVTVMSIAGADGGPGTELVRLAEALDIDPKDAALLHAQALDFIGRRPAEGALSPGSCREYLRRSFLDDYWDYVRTAQLTPEHGTLASGWRAWWLKRRSAARLLAGPTQ